MSKGFVTAFLVGVLFSTVSPVAEAKSGRAALRMIPSGTAMVLAINVDAVRGSTIFDKLVAKMAAQNALKPAIELLKQGAGIDLRKDVSTLVVALASDFRRSRKSALFVEAAVDRKKLLAFIKRSDPTFKKARHGKTTYYKLNADLELAFLGRYTVIAGKGHMIRVLNARANRAPSLHLHTAFRTMLAPATISSDIWAVVHLPKQVQGALISQLGGHALTTIMASLNFARGMDLHLRLALGSAVSAQAVATQLRTWLATAGGNAQLGAMGLTTALQTFKVAVQAPANNTMGSRKIDVTGVFTTKQLAPIKTMLLNLL